jgi:hypothetical protein
MFRTTYFLIAFSEILTIPLHRKAEEGQAKKKKKKKKKKNKKKKY